MALHTQSESAKRHQCLIIACGALAKEIVFLRKNLGENGASIDLQCLPAEFHNSPQKIAPAIESLLEKKRKHYDRVLVAYGECGTGGALDKVLDKYDAQRLAGAHCYEFFAGPELFEKITGEELGSFFLTDYLVKNFDRLVWQGLGLDRYPHLRDAYFSNYTQLVYLAQVEDADLIARAKAAAQELGLNFVHKTVGYGGLGAALLALSRKQRNPVPCPAARSTRNVSR